MIMTVIRVPHSQCNHTRMTLFFRNPTQSLRALPPSSSNVFPNLNNCFSTNPISLANYFRTEQQQMSSKS